VAGAGAACGVPVGSAGVTTIWTVTLPWMAFFCFRVVAEGDPQERDERLQERVQRDQSGVFRSELDLDSRSGSASNR
jgi:hypothetical protein